MAKFMCTHTLPPGQMTREQVDQIAAESQKDPTVKGYRSFLNLSQGKAVCIWEAPNERAVAAWFDKMDVPYDSILSVELEGYQGKVTELTPAREHARA